jgi:hypothetical protein
MRASAITAVVVALVLSGCVAHPPPPATDEQLAEYTQHVLDQTWQSTGLEGTVDRPQVDAAQPAPMGDWLNSLSTCMKDVNDGSFTFEFNSDEGYVLSGGDAPTTVTLYTCIAANPLDYRRDGGGFLTDAQLEYIYDYYADWLVPCMVNHGYTMTDAPSRDDFVASQGFWSPYVATANDVTATELEPLCGPERPQLY